MCKWRKCVFGCERFMSLFSLPKDKNVRQKWLEFIFGSTRASDQQLYVCDGHFSEDCLANLGQYQSGLAVRLNLKTGAIPSIKPEGEIRIIKIESVMDSELQIGFIGAGNMAFGIAKGILSGGNVLPTNVKVSAPSFRNLGRFQELSISTTHSNAEVVCSSNIIFVAVKPHLVPIVLREISLHITDRHTIVSVAAGVTLATLEELLPAGSCVIRLMPNLPCVVLQGALLFTRGTHAKDEHGALLCSLLQPCGLVEEGPEAWIDIHTGLSGSGVAFVYVFAEALAEGAVKMGMPSALAQRIAAQTVLGAGQLLLESKKHPAQLRSEVCTPGGTTIYGLHALEQGGVRAAAMTAVESATERARELGRKSADQRSNI
ncbi:pyrroline-5-carboxylate reductase 3 isoform X2 [Syngnathus acus]|uniref:pyrroline-5-carboxylate reductase 3 isoform X2 n=1 Tax=Syngnathus acus TaxID=161584 RepID=UPI0018860895|nr:pyrroline-5-carboxylate reductase 3 isoform X2 [Syngnathus acus]